MVSFMAGMAVTGEVSITVLVASATASDGSTIALDGAAATAGDTSIVGDTTGAFTTAASTAGAITGAAIVVSPRSETANRGRWRPNVPWEPTSDAWASIA